MEMEMEKSALYYSLSLSKNLSHSLSSSKLSKVFACVLWLHEYYY